MVSISKQNEVPKSQEVSSSPVDTEVASRHEVNTVDNVAEKSIGGVGLVGASNSGKQVVGENTMQDVEMMATHEGILLP